MSRRTVIAGCGLLLAGAGAALLWRLSGEQVNVGAPTNRQLARLEPADGTLYGVNLDWEHDSAAAYTMRLGKSPYVYVAFAHFPVPPDDNVYLDNFVAQVLQQRGLALLTLEPVVQLQDITPDMANDFAQRIAEYNARGVPVLVRFAHEMNGSWYPWGQQPSAYIRAFRIVAEAVHVTASNSAMLWAPNYGAGYPFTGGTYEINPNSSDFSLLDTNHDGILDTRDDMYAPYYPGDDAVDWVGMTLYHWGDTWPWGKNVIPEPEKFVSQLSGTYNGAGGDDRGLPDFYREYAERRAKPLAIPETAALYNTSGSGGDSELDIKRAWWRQVFSAEVVRKFPLLKMINWFEWRKPEAELDNAVVDWTATLDPTIREAFVTDLSSQNQLVFAPGPSPASATPPAAPQATSGPSALVSEGAPPVGVTPTALVSLPSVGSDVRRVINFAGYEWHVRSANELEGPGPNYFSDAPNHVWVDDSGLLHLRAAQDADGRWYCAEVESAVSSGYGTYEFVLASRVDGLDPNVAVGFFTWSDDPAENHRELDIEFATFGQITSQAGRYTLQPYTNPENVFLFKPPATEASTHSFEWRPSDVTFQSWTASAAATGPAPQLVARHTFARDVPTPGGEHVHMNVWLDNGQPPVDGQPIEIVVRGFTFRPPK